MQLDITCVAFCSLNSSHKDATVNFKKRNSAAALSAPTSFTHWLCVPTQSLPTGNANTGKASLLTGACQAIDLQDRDFLFFFSFQNKISPAI